jgi:arylsulfatase A-like enzyme
MSIKLTVLFLSFVVSSAAAGSEKPNIILIFVDDLGYGDVGCYGNTAIETPNIDKLASEGQRWTSFYASGSTCVPSRTGLMSGRHPALLGDAPLSQDPGALLPAMLKRQGYRNAILGKWHLAGYPEDFTSHPMHPLECGFDYHFGTPGSNDVPPPPGQKQTRQVFDESDNFSFPVPLIRGRELVEKPANQELFTQRYTQEAVRWIQENKDQTFFLYLAHNMPHAPVFASPEFQGKSDGGRFGDVVEEIDWSVGQVMSTLQKVGLDEKTLVIFSSDNGPWTVFGPHGGTAKPLRGEKATNWEGGFRVPTIFRWPGKIAPAVIDGIGANLDLYATLAAITGGAEPSGKPGFISVDLSQTLLQGSPSARSWWLYASSGFRSGDYKILLTTNAPTNAETRRRSPTTRHDPPLLFNLAKDLSEQRNIAEEHPEIVSRVLSEMRAVANIK